MLVTLKSVDVLGDQGVQSPQLLQFGQGKVSGVGPGIAEALVALELVVPIFDPFLFGLQKVLKVDRLPFFSNSLGSPKVGNPRSGRDASSGKYQYAAGAGPIVSHVHNRTIASSSPRGNLLRFKLPKASLNSRTAGRLPRRSL